jgi:hypothetical protein
MNKRLLFCSFWIIALLACSFSASAFSASKYATTSRLATGKWVKIAIPEDGIYQITYTELAQMGFHDPQSVRIYGAGGHAINEVLDGNAPDDLQQVPCKHFDNKLCFYGLGPVEYTLIYDSGTSKSRFTRVPNSYSQAGYYFITCNDGSQLKEVTNTTYGITGSNLRLSSLDYLHYEQELVSASQSGKDMLGEIITNNTITLPYSIHSLCPDSAIIVNPCIVSKNDSASTLSALVNDAEAPFTIGNNTIPASGSQYTYYNMASPSAIFRPQNGAGIPKNGTLTFDISTPGKTKWARFDYYMLTYYHPNSIQRVPYGQLRMAFDNVSSADIIAIEATNTPVQMWSITNPQQPTNYNLTTNGNYSGFTPLYTINWAQFIAFNPNEQLKSIAGYENVENQNIHGLPTPDMIIVTCEELLSQAERIAQMHRDNDNMIVHVIDQQKIFNEFSSGTPDAMAIRLMCKMFYDRNKNKFKYLLMFGAGTQDNRQIRGKRECTILTYESTASNDENNSYVSDDFFGFMDDNSGQNPAAAMLRLRVGRIPCASIEEAKNDVDKLLNYVNNPDYGPWRNNMLLVADDNYVDDQSMHPYQAEGIGNVINNELKVGLIKNKVFASQFPVDPVTSYSVEGRKNLSLMLKMGQYFMTYVGHANPYALTKTLRLWTSSDAQTTSNPHLPIITTACCDVARYDGSERGLMEIMFHKPDGGAIAMVAATRSAYASGNDALNQAFVRNMFCFKNKGYMPTLGEAYMLCKQAFGTTAAYNKMMFSLLGDPAMKINHPKPYFTITKINGKTVSTSNIYSGALQQITIEAKVYNPDGTTVNTSFNGDATLSIYDYLKKETTYSSRDIYHPRKLLTQVSGRVVNGVFNVSAVIPRYTLSPGSAGLVAVYAHRDNSDEMVNGSFDKLILNSYDENNGRTIHDDTPPTIEAIYFNDEEEFDLCEQVEPTSTLYIRATDDYAFNNQAVAVGNSMDVKIDDGKITIPNVNYYASMSDNGKTLEVKLPLTLEQGDHVLQYTVYDAAGNMATRAINYAVGGTQRVTLSVDQEPAVEYATFNMKTNLTTKPSVTIKVFNHLGSLKWYTTTSEFPFNWDLKTRGGTPLPPGVYTYYGRFNDGTTYGGTNKGTIVIGRKHQTQ